MEEKRKRTVSGIVGALVGMGLTVGIYYKFSPTEGARFIEKEDMPRVIKVDNYAAADRILIENPNSAGEYIPLSDYLERFDNKYERKFERARIKLSVSQGETQ